MIRFFHHKCSHSEVRRVPVTVDKLIVECVLIAMGSRKPSPQQVTAEIVTSHVTVLGGGDV
eukprot:SAG31_NODE_59_length_29571_cov_20.443506_17_plen_61_part_00